LEKFEKTKENLSRLRKKICNCCGYCNDNKEFVNNFNLESNDLNLYNKDIDNIERQVLRENNIRIISTCVSDSKEVIDITNNIVEDEGIKNISSKSIVKEGNSHYKSNQSKLKDRENNIEDNVNCVCFPANPYRKESMHVFMNIIQPRKPLSFLPLDISSLHSSIEKSEGAVEKYLFNIKERKLYKLIHLKVDLDNTILPVQQISFVSLDLFKAIFNSLIQRISE
jgi:hypothetical protein